MIKQNKGGLLMLTETSCIMERGQKVTGVVTNDVRDTGR